MTNPILSQSMADFGLPGVIIELDPDEAEAWGAFEETAITEQDAIESEIDMEIAE
jgi:type IV secretion system protein VirB1